MSKLLHAEHRRRQAHAALARQTTEQDRLRDFLAAARPHVVEILHSLGQVWEAIDMDRIAIPQPPLLARLLAPPPSGVVCKAYQVTTLGGPESRGDHFCLALGWLILENGQYRLDYRRGLEAGGLLVGIGYEDRIGGYFTLSATRPYLPAYHKTFYTLTALLAALTYEWERGTFLGPYAHCTPFHLQAPPSTAAR